MGSDQPATVHTTVRTATAPLQPPPEPRSFRATPLGERISRHPSDVSTTPKEEKKKGIFARLWPFKASEPVYLGAQNPERGMEATRRVVRDGVLDPRYKGAARRATALICAMPIMLYLTWELYQRRFLGKEQKRRLVVAPKSSEAGL